LDFKELSKRLEKFFRGKANLRNIVLVLGALTLVALLSVVVT